MTKLGIEKTNIDKLLVRYLGGETTAEEAAKAEQWINATKENAAYFEQYKQIWNESSKLAGNSNIGTDSAWQRFNIRIKEGKTAKPKPIYYIQWLRVAAIFLLVCGAALFSTRYFKHDGRLPVSALRANSVKKQEFITAAAAGNVIVDTLPDSSLVTLNKYSRLAYLPNFTGPDRYVELTGEAFFRIKHTPRKPFVVKAGDILISVMGTSFNVRIAGDTTEVIVATGIVKVRKNHAAIVLFAGEKTVVFESSAVLSKSVSHSRLYRRYFDSSVTNAHAPNIQSTQQWDSLLVNFEPQSDKLNFRRAVINMVLKELAKEKIIAPDSIRSFRLNENELLINDKRQPGYLHQRLKDMFIKESGYTIYLGGSPKTRKGVFLSRDSL